MRDAEISDRYTFADTLIREAGTVANRYFNDREALTVRNKGPQDIASEADLNTETLIRQRVNAAFPEDGFLGEETGSAAAERNRGIWVVDPIDGTQPFIYGLSSWCVSLAFVVDQVLRFGMVYAPALNELFAGGLGFPATCNGRRLAPQPAADLSAGIVGIGYSPKSEPEEFLFLISSLVRRGGTFYRNGSGALALCYVASGGLIGYIETHIKSWDCLGAVAVISAAGLQVNDFFADGGFYNGNPIIAGSPGVYAALSEIHAELVNR